MNEPTKLECYISQGREGQTGPKHPGLFGPLINYEEDKVPEVQTTTQTFP
jgi:hypothetical protein